MSEEKNTTILKTKDGDEIKVTNDYWFTIVHHEPQKVFQVSYPIRNITRIGLRTNKSNVFYTEIHIGSKILYTEQIKEKDEAESIHAHLLKLLSNSTCCSAPYKDE